MKNILADNLLRFGVRNLSESDIKTIKETVLTEGYVDPITKVNYKLDFANTANFQKYAQQALPSTSVNFFNSRLVKIGDLVFPKNTPEEDATNLVNIIWQVFAVLGKMPNAINATSYRTIVSNFNEAAPELQKLGTAFMQPRDVLSNSQNAIAWQTAVDKNKPNYTYWNLFVDSCLRPNIEYKTSLIKPQTALSTKQTTPQKP